MSDSLEILKGGLEQDRKSNTHHFLILILFLIVGSVWMSHFMLSGFIDDNKKAVDKLEEKLERLNNIVIKNSTILKMKSDHEKHN